MDLSYKLGLLAKDCIDLMHTFEDIRVKFVRRFANQCAHALARAMGFQFGHGVWNIMFKN